jgi:hypothetical protein
VRGEKVKAEVDARSVSVASAIVQNNVRATHLRLHSRPHSVCPSPLKGTSPRLPFGVTRFDTIFATADLAAYQYCRTCLKFGALAGAGALKHPRAAYCKRVFVEAQATASPEEYPVELGRVVVAQSRKGQRLSTPIVGELLAFAKNENVFATTRADDRAIRLAAEYGFKPNGKPYPSGRGYNLVLYLRNAAQFPITKE